MPRRTRDEYEEISTPSSNVPSHSFDGLPVNITRCDHFKPDILKQSIVEALFEPTSTKRLADISGTPILTLCEFFVAGTSGNSTICNCAKWLRAQVITSEHSAHRWVQAKLSEIEIIEGQPIRFQFRSSTVIRSSTHSTDVLHGPPTLNMNANNQVVEWGLVTPQEITQLRVNLCASDFSTRDQTMWPKNLKNTLHRISKVSGGFIIRCGSLRDRYFDLTHQRRSTSIISHGLGCYRYSRYKDKITYMLQILANEESLLLVSPPGNGKTSLLRELLRGISFYAQRNQDIGGRAVLIDRQHEIMGTGTFGRALADPCIISPESGSGLNTPGMMNAMEQLTAKWIIVDEVNTNDAVREASVLTERGTTLLATAHFKCNSSGGGSLVKNEELIASIMNSQSNMLLGGQQKNSAKSSAEAKRNGTKQDTWKSKTTPAFKWIVYLRDLSPGTWTLPMYIPTLLAKLNKTENDCRGSGVSSSGGGGNGYGNGNDERPAKAQDKFT